MLMNQKNFVKKNDYIIQVILFRKTNISREINEIEKIYLNTKVKTEEIKFVVGFNRRFSYS